VPRSGSSLLDTTPTPKLALVDSDREIEAAAKAEPAKEEAEDEQPISSRDFVEVMRPKVTETKEEDEEAPISSRDFVQVIRPEPATARVSRAPPIPERASRAPVADRGSIPADRQSQPAPPPPARGSLKTLPPDRADLPPPTISVDEGPKSKRTAAARAVEARPSMAHDEKPTSWVLPIVGIVAAGAIVWLLTRDSTQPNEAPVATTQSAAPSVSVAPSAPKPSAEPSASIASVPSTEPSASASATPAEPHRPVDINTLSLAELLDRASGARRGGDRARAKQLYEKALEHNPGNAEAYAGLGDVARASGDIPAAKDAYQKALTTSPGYFPAQLGMADIEWDSGDRASARQRYAEIASRIGANAPARVRERLADTPAPVPPAPSAAPSAEP
jgi:hypothetical protein